MKQFFVSVEINIYEHLLSKPVQMELECFILFISICLKILLSKDNAIFTNLFCPFVIERRELDYSYRLDGRAGYWRLALSVSSSIIVKDKYRLNKNRNICSFCNGLHQDWIMVEQI